MRSRFSSFLVAAATLSVALTAPHALAIGEDEASPNAKGTVGGALLGGEAVMLVEAGLGVRQPWAYVAGGLAGGVGGGVGGYLIEQNSDSAKLPMFLLTGGIVLIVPTAVAVLASTAYKPPANYVQDRAPADEPVAEPPQPSSPAPTTTPAPTSKQDRKHKPRTRRAVAPERLSVYRSVPLPSAPPSLVGIDRGLLSLSLPAVQLRDVYSKREMLQTGLKPATEVRIPVFNFSF